MGWAQRANRQAQDKAAGKIKPKPESESSRLGIKFDPMEAMIRQIRRNAGLRPRGGRGKQ